MKTYRGHVNKELSLSGALVSCMHGRPQEAFTVSGSDNGGLVVRVVTTKEVLSRGWAHEDVLLSVGHGKAKHRRGLLVSRGKDRDVRIRVGDIDPSALKDDAEIRRRQESALDAYGEVDAPEIEDMNAAPWRRHGRR